MNIVAAAWLLPRWGAVAVAGIDAVTFLLTTFAGLYGFTEWEVVTGGALLYTEMTLRVFSLFLVGMLSGFLSENLQRTRFALLASEQAVAQIQAEHHVILNQLDTGILVVDDSGLIQAVNPAGARILGPVLMKPLTEVLAPLEELWEQGYRVGHVHRVLVCRRQVLERGGTVVVVEDITKWKKMEEKVAREERLAAVGRLAAGLAHEIRNPLASLSGSCLLYTSPSPRD